VDNPLAKWQVISWLCLLIIMTGCSKAPTPAQPLWEKQSLIDGQDVLVRINRQRQFNYVIFECPANAIEVVNKKGETIQLPEKFKRIYIKKKRDKLKLAFKPGKAAFKKAKTYQEIIIKSIDEASLHYQLIIPQIGLKRIYEAKSFNLSIKYNRLAVVNQLPMEMYIARVIPAEMDPDHFTLEALKAQAVVARTWAIRNRRRHLRFGYNFCDGPHCQVYKGRKLVSSRSEKATKITAGEVIAINDKVVDSFYHSTCGGNTAFVHEVWKGRPQAHLNRVEDRWKATHRAYCARSPYYNWSVIMSLNRLEQVLKKGKQVAKRAELQDAKVHFVNRSGRVLKVKLITNKEELYLQFQVLPDGKSRSIKMLDGKKRHWQTLRHLSTGRLLNHIKPGGQFTETYQLAIPAELKPGSYQIQLSIIEPKNKERLTVDTDQDSDHYYLSVLEFFVKSTDASLTNP